jgi:ABC-type multidrug transport system fused ATPase/permease subunit
MANSNLCPTGALTGDLRSALSLINQAQQESSFRLAELRWVSSYVKPHWKRALWALSLMVLVSLMFAPIPYMIKVIVDSVLPNRDGALLSKILGLLILLQLVRPLISFLANYNFTILGQSVQVALREDLFRHLLRLPLPFFEKNQSGYLVARIGEVSSLSIFFSNAMLIPFLGILECTIGLIMMFVIDWRLALVAIGLLPAIYVAAKYQGRGIQFATRSLLEQNALVTQQIQESLAGVSTIKEFAAEERETIKIAAKLKRLYQKSVSRHIASSIADESLTTLIEVTGLLVLWLCGFAILNGTLTVGDYIAFSAYMLKFFGPARMMATLSLSIRPAVASLRRVNGLLAEVVEDSDPQRTISITSLKGTIEVKDISFAYADRDVLKGVSLDIRPGECTALVGPSGSGKTTLVRLLLGLYPLRTGSILIDGYDLSQIILSELRERIGIVSQNTFLFNNTLRNNILYGLPNATEADLIRAAHAADAHEFIQALPHGYDTPVGEHGVRLSGGQRQRISIARTLLKNPDIVIFDEATSQLDSESETRIWRSAEQLFGNKTRIVISHRIGSVISADQIVVMENGEVVASGRHSDLLLNCDRYRQLLTSRATVNSTPGEVAALPNGLDVSEALLGSDSFNRALRSACKMLGIDNPGEHFQKQSVK